MLSKGHEKKREMMDAGKVLCTDIKITENNKGLCGEDNEQEFSLKLKREVGGGINTDFKGTRVF